MARHASSRPLQLRRDAVPGLLALAALVSACSPGSAARDASDDAAPARCGMDAGPGSDDAGVPTFAQVETLFARSCALPGPYNACHAAPANAGGLDLSAAVAYAQIVRVPSQEAPAMARVSPGAPAESYLLHKVEGTLCHVPDCRRAGADCGVQMPPASRGPLSADQLALLRAWIVAGAPGPGR